MILLGNRSVRFSDAGPTASSPFSGLCLITKNNIEVVLVTRTLAS